MLNRVFIMGRLCADPEIRQTQAGIAYCKIRVAVNRPKKKDEEQQADFINVSCWRQTAEFVGRYFSKGKMIIVEGSLRNNDYTDNNGVKHYSMDVLANSVEFGETKSASEGAGQPQQNTVPQYGTVPAPANNPLAPQSAANPASKPQSNLSIGDLNEFEDILSEGELPF